MGDGNKLSVTEFNQVIHEFNNTSVYYQKELLFLKLFEAQVEKSPAKTALIFEGEKMSYQVLNERANKLARFLMKRDVVREDVVGLMVTRSFDLIIGILGILKSGAAYLPLDSAYPRNRIDLMLRDSNAKILLTQSEIRNVNFKNTDVIYIDDESISEEAGSNLKNVNSPYDLIYIIYTSGSTGTPKGVMIEHRAIINFIKGMNSIDFASNKRILLLTSLSFDIFFLEGLFPLTKGWEIVIANQQQHNNLKLLGELILNSNVEILQMTPSRIQVFLESSQITDYLKNIKIILLGGEVLHPKLVEKIKNVSDAKIFNMYGPTETTIWSTVKEIGSDGRINIGKPISNTQIYILDDEMNPVPIGIRGEIYIGGDGLARGYRNQPDMTINKFIKTWTVLPRRIYRTGDLAKWLPDGDIEFLGRADQQVKLKGFRIELGEIESHIEEHPLVIKAVVKVWENANGSKYLCAYFVSDVLVVTSELKEYIGQKLPNYMLPSCFIQLKKMPITVNGKIDRESLPRPNYLEDSEKQYFNSKNDIQDRLVHLFEEILNRQGIGINDNFFEIGGDSLNAMRLSLKAFYEFNVELPFGEIYRLETINAISGFISDKKKIIGNLNKNEPFIVFNQDSNKKTKIFIFPAIGGYAIGYGVMADILINHTLYSFDFIYGDDKANVYKELITKYQAQGSYILMGYSAGGNLAFEIAKRLHRDGYIVSDLILLDSDFRYEDRNLTYYELDNISSRIYDFISNNKPELQALTKDRQFKDGFINDIRCYVRYLSSFKHTGTIDANIHLILSEDSLSDIDIKRWGSLTNGSLKQHKGFGKHYQMLNKEYAIKNAKVIHDILLGPK